jgi:DNA-binding response OmpR family regulator
MQIGVESQRAVENKRVFVIDSDEVSSLALQFMLADDNETHVIADLTAALAKSRDWPPHLVLLGAGNLASTGPAAVSVLKTAVPGVKVVVVCDAATEPPVSAALAAGADGVLTRPLTLEAVRRKVDGYLGRRAAVPIAVVVR